MKYLEKININDMKRVWKCDFCMYTQEILLGMKEHEETCSFNPKNKKCFTCKHSYDSGYDYSIHECEKNLSVADGRDNGRCVGWESDYDYKSKIVRKKKLIQIFDK